MPESKQEITNDKETNKNIEPLIKNTKRMSNSNSQKADTVKTPELKQTLPKTEKTEVTNETPKKETSKTVKSSSKDKSAKSVIVKSGPTDLRRGAKGLTDLIENVMEKDPKNGDKYIFSNKKKGVKMLEETDNGTVLTTLTKNTQIEGFPEYRPKGTPGYTVELEGKKAKEFLDEMGLPKK